MDRSEIDELVQRLVENPHDEEALAYAHQSGESDPKAYATLLERVGEASKDTAFAAHWLGEAANVWLTTLADAHRAARLLMAAVAKDPTASVPAETTRAALSRQGGCERRSSRFLERRSKALSGLISGQPELRGELAGMYEEMGRLWTEAPLSQPKKAIECFKKAMDTDPTSAYAIYNARELLKQQGSYKDALAALRRGARDRARSRSSRRTFARRSADAKARTRSRRRIACALRSAQSGSRRSDAVARIRAEHSRSHPSRMSASPTDERRDASGTLVGLAESYQGEHGFAYAAAALDVSAGR